MTTKESSAAAVKLRSSARLGSRWTSMLLIAVLVGWAGGCTEPEETTDTASSPTTEQAGSQVALRFSQPQDRTLETNYLLFLPSSYAQDTERSWPLVVHLHGGGARGTDPEKLRAYPLVQRLDEEPDFPFVVVTPQCPPGRPGPLGDLWTEHSDLVLAILDEVVETHRIDPERIYLIGHSMGGYGAWYLGHRASERFAAIAPMSCPGVTWWAYRIAEADVPVWVFHGEDDEAVPIAESERMVATIRNAGGTVRFTRYPERGHVIREPFEGDELFEWLVTHRRETNASGP